jgi:hypothetical protein
MAARGQQALGMHKILNCAAAAVLCHGCADYAPRDLDRARIAGKHNLALTGPMEPRQYGIFDTDAVLASALTGAIVGIEAGQIAGQAATMPTDKPSVAAKLHLGQEIRSVLISELEAENYRVTYFDAPRGTIGGTDFAADLSAAPVSSDLIMDCVVTAGYDNGTTRAYVPWIRLIVRLFDRKTMRPIFIHHFIYAGHDPDGSGPNAAVVADQSYNYASRDEIISHPERAIRAFHSSVQPLAKLVADSIRQ